MRRAELPGTAASSARLRTGRSTCPCAGHRCPTGNWIRSLTCDMYHILMDVHKRVALRRSADGSGSLRITSINIACMLHDCAVCAEPASPGRTHALAGYSLIMMDAKNCSSEECTGERALGSLRPGSLDATDCCNNQACTLDTQGNQTGLHIKKK